MPPFPDVPAAQTGTLQVHPRYDDISQDGRVVLGALQHTAGMLLWARLLRAHPLTAGFRAQGVLPILTRAVLCGDSGVVSVASPLTAAGGYELTHTRDADGSVARIMLNGWATIQGPSARTYGPMPPDHGELKRVGSAFLEHVFTRPFAPPGQRKVLALSMPGVEAVPGAAHAWRAPEAALTLPPGARPLEDALSLEDAPAMLGLDETDSNQHVNSLVHTRVFRAAALRRLARLGHDTRLLARYAEVAYRKPWFAGEAMHVALRAFELGGQPGAVGCLLPAKAGDTIDLGTARCYLQMVFSP